MSDELTPYKPQDESIVVYQSKNGANMKCRIILLCTILSLLAGCGEKPEQPSEQNPPETEQTDEPYDPDPFGIDMMFITFVKLASTEYLQYVVAEREWCLAVDTIQEENYSYMCRTAFSGGPDTVMYGMRGPGAVYQELFLGTNPYISLGDDYFLVDWKWGDFMGEFFYNPSVLLLNVKWEEVKNRNQVWPVEQPLIATDFVLQKRSVSRKRIDDYLGITNTAPMDSNFNLSVDYIRPWLVWQYNSLAEFQDSIATSPLMPYRPFNTVESYNAEVARQDSLQQVYTERLRLVIANGQIDDLFKKKSGH